MESGQLSMGIDVCHSDPALAGEESHGILRLPPRRDPQDDKNVFSYLIDLFFPKNCLNCGQAETWLCQDCSRKINRRLWQNCPICGQANYWGEYCLPHRRFLDGLWAATDYQDNLVQSIIKIYKYRFVKDLTTILNQWLIALVEQMLKVRQAVAAEPPLFLRQFVENIIIPVPLSRRRRNWRGFNQSEILAKGVADFFNLTIKTDGLARRRHTKPQTELTEERRLKNLQTAFVWRGESLIGKNIILVDDVTTTGATLQECAKVLKQAGASQVWGLVLAH